MGKLPNQKPAGVRLKLVVLLLYFFPSAHSRATRKNESFYGNEMSLDNLMVFEIDEDAPLSFEIASVACGRSALRSAINRLCWEPG